MQKSLTVQGKRYSGQQITDQFDEKNMTNGGDYIINLNGQRYFANYRQVQDAQFAPVCSAGNANAVALMPDDGSYQWSTWVTL